MEGSGEGVVALIQGLQDAGLAVTVVSQRHRRQDAGALPLRLERRSAEALALGNVPLGRTRVLALKKKSAPRLNSSMQTSAEPVQKISTAAQAFDERYASSYQLAHCGAKPTSPPVYSSEFPPQRSHPSRVIATDGNFETGSYGSGEFVHSPTVKLSLRSSLKWPDRGSAGCRGASCQTDAFAHSLRRYSSLHPTRTMSVDLIERLIKATQAKNLSKISKSMRTIPRNNPADIKEGKQTRKTKRVQTYTRARQHEEKESTEQVDGNILRQEESNVKRPSNRRRSKRPYNNVSATYDYLKPAGGLHRKRCHRVTDVRYLDGVAKFVKDSLQSICDEKTLVCPNVQGRYQQHRRQHHLGGQTSNMTDNSELQASVPSGSRDWPVKKEATSAICSKSCSTRSRFCAYCHRPMPCPCTTKNIQTISQWPQVVPRSPMLPKSCGFANNTSRLRSCGLNTREQSDTYNQNYKTEIENQILAWLKELPIFSDESPDKRVAREAMVTELANTLKDISHDEYFDDNARNEILKCLNMLPMWLPGSESEQKNFREQIARNLLNKLKTISNKSDQLPQIIKDWVNKIPSNESKMLKQDFIELIVDQLKPVIINRPSNDENYINILKPKIAEILKELALNCLKDVEADVLTNSLVDNLIKLPKIVSGRNDSFLEIQSIIKDWLRKEDDFNYILLTNIKKAFENLCEKIHGLKTKEHHNDIEREINTFLNNIGVQNLERITTLTHKLMNKINENMLSNEDKTRTDNDKNIIQQLIIDEVDNFLSDASAQIPTEKKEELRKTLVDMLLNNEDQIMTQHFEESSASDENDRMIDKLFERVKGIYLGSRAASKPLSNLTLSNEPNQTFQKNNVYKDDVQNGDDLILNHVNTTVGGLLGQELSKSEDNVIDFILNNDLTKGSNKRSPKNLANNVIKDSKNNNKLSKIETSEISRGQKNDAEFSAQMQKFPIESLVARKGNNMYAYPKNKGVKDDTERMPMNSNRQNYKTFGNYHKFPVSDNESQTAFNEGEKSNYDTLGIEAKKRYRENSQVEKSNKLDSHIFHELQPEKADNDLYSLKNYFFSKNTHSISSPQAHSRSQINLFQDDRIRKQNENTKLFEELLKILKKLTTDNEDLEKLFSTSIEDQKPQKKYELRRKRKMEQNIEELPSNIVPDAYGPEDDDTESYLTDLDVPKHPKHLKPIPNRVSPKETLEMDDYLQSASEKSINVVNETLPNTSKSLKDGPNTKLQKVMKSKPNESNIRDNLNKGSKEIILERKSEDTYHLSDKEYTESLLLKEIKDLFKKIDIGRDTIDLESKILKILVDLIEKKKNADQTKTSIFNLFRGAKLSVMQSKNTADKLLKSICENLPYLTAEEKIIDLESLNNKNIPLNIDKQRIPQNSDFDADDIRHRKQYQIIKTLEEKNGFDNISIDDDIVNGSIRKLLIKLYEIFKRLENISGQANSENVSPLLLQEISDIINDSSLPITSNDKKYLNNIVAKEISTGSPKEHIAKIIIEGLNEKINQKRPSETYLQESNKTTYSKFKSGLDQLNNRSQSRQGIPDKFNVASSRRDIIAPSKPVGVITKANNDAIVDENADNSVRDSSNNLVNRIGMEVKVPDDLSEITNVVSRHCQDDKRQKITQVITDIFASLPIKISRNTKNHIKNRLVDILSTDILSLDSDEINTKIQNILLNETKLQKGLVNYTCNEIIDGIKKNMSIINERFSNAEHISFRLQSNSDLVYSTYNECEQNIMKFNADMSLISKPKRDMTTSTDVFITNIKTHLRNEIINLLHKYNVSFSKKEIIQSTKYGFHKVPSSSKEMQTQQEEYNNQDLTNYPRHHRFPFVYSDKDDNIFNNLSDGNRSEYMNKLLKTDKWDTVPVDFIKSRFKDNMVNSLVKDVIGKHKYLHLHPISDELDYTNHKAFKYSNLEDCKTVQVALSKPSIRELMKHDKLVDSPPLAESSRKSLGADKDQEKQSQDSLESRPRVTKPDSIYDFIDSWCEKLPFIENSLNNESLNNLKHGIAKKVLKKICELNFNPEILNDASLYEDVMRDEVGGFVNEIQSYLLGGESIVSNLKEELIQKIKEARIKTLNELAGQAYKQELRDAVSRTLSSELDISSEEDQVSFNALKDALAEAFISLNYTLGNDDLHNRIKNKITNEIIKFCNDYLKRHPETPICSKRLNEALYTNLKNVYLPTDESMRSEVEYVRIKDVLCDWIKDLPMADTSSSAQDQIKRMVSILANRLHGLEKAKIEGLHTRDEMKTEITKWLKKLTLQPGQDSYIDRYANDLMDVLKNTEFSRKFRASTRLSNDIVDSLPFGEDPTPCPEYCLPQISPCSISREDCEHLERIRERARIWESKMAKRICTDAAVSPCMDSGSQTDVRTFASMKSVHSVCPRAFRAPISTGSTHLRRTPSYHAPCWSPRPAHLGVKLIPSEEIRGCGGGRRTRGAVSCSPGESYADLQPQVIIKEYYWDSAGSPTTVRIPGRNTSQESPRPSVRNAQQTSSPQTFPEQSGSQKLHTRSPPMSTTDQEPRRQRFKTQSAREPGSPTYSDRFTHLGSLDDTRDPDFRTKSTEAKWSSVRFPDDDDFWGAHGPNASFPVSDEEPFQREREKQEERVKCRCRERVVRMPKRKARNYDRDSHQSNNTKNYSKCCAAQCPHPSYLYFRQ